MGGDALTFHDPLPVPYDRAPTGHGPVPQAETISLVQSQIDALLSQTPAYYELRTADRDRLRADLTHIGAYAAELVRDDWAQSRKLGQRPVIIQEKTYRPEPVTPLPPAPHEKPGKRSLSRSLAQNNLQTNATGRVADITQSTLRAIAFPTFVADLINGTFDAIIGATIKQMNAFMDLVAQVSKTVGEYERDNVTDNQARDYLVQQLPGLLEIVVEDEQPTLVITEAGEAAEAPALAFLQGTLGLPAPVTRLEDDLITEQLVPAARRKLAQTRLQMLSTMVMMGLQRIVIRHGRLKATMGFHIDASDRAHAEEASSFDFAHENSVSGFFYVAFSAKTSVAYVTSQQSDSDSAINVQADLTGEVDLTFETDYLPLNRLARAESIEQIRANTPNPEANQPNEAAKMTARTAPAAGNTAAGMVSSGVAAHRAEPAPVIDQTLINAAANRTGTGSATPAKPAPAAKPAPVATPAPATGNPAPTPAAPAPVATPAPATPAPAVTPAPAAAATPAPTGTAAPAPAPAATPAPAAAAPAPAGGGGINLAGAANAVGSIIGLVAGGAG